MTPLPKKKHTRARSGKRRNSPSKARSLPNLVVCQSCKKLTLPHRACFYCGFYKK